MISRTGLGLELASWGLVRRKRGVSHLEPDHSLVDMRTIDHSKFGGALHFEDMGANTLEK